MFRRFSASAFALPLNPPFPLVFPRLDVLEDKSVLRIATPADLKECVKEEEKGLDESVAVPSMISDEQLASLDALNKDSKPLLIPTEVIACCCCYWHACFVYFIY